MVEGCIEITKKHHLPVTVKVSAIMRDLRIPSWLDGYIRKVYRDVATMVSNYSYHPYTKMTMYRNELDGINRYLIANAKDIYQ